MLRPNTYYAHSVNEQGERQLLSEHVEAVAGLTETFGASFSAGAFGRLAGLWHDLGKYNPAWQEYLLEAEAGKRAGGTGPDHKGRGTAHARELAPLAFAIAGHHGGLMDHQKLRQKLSEWKSSGTSEFALPPEAEPWTAVQSPTFPPETMTRLGTEFFTRMVFSALVDADFLDTERHFDPDAAASRTQGMEMEELWARFRAFHSSLPAGKGRVSEVRTAVYSDCLEAAASDQGVFRLTVPTGGGKTLSSMAFALKHAIQHNLERIIVAVPFTTITEQTADVYRSAFGIQAESPAVLEHHSAVDPTRTDDQTRAGLWSRLAAENWDAPIIVTTTVQLFDSIFARRTGKCRKVHRLASSVLILDEAQALPPHVLDPILDALRRLSSFYKTSVVLCTATQPALDDAPGFRGLTDVRDIVKDPQRHFQKLRRVEYESVTETWSWDRVADEALSAQQSLVILNTVGNSADLFDAVDSKDPDALYLSTRLCGAHRRAVLSAVKQRLGARMPCHLVSTQVVEAGVDVDFPLVLRALGPLDSIVQAAGRCNREGGMKSGRVVIFQPEDGSMPRGPYRTAFEATRNLFLYSDPDLHDPDVYQRYFRGLLGSLNLDEAGVTPLRDSLSFETVAERFRMIKDHTVSVFVGYDKVAGELIDACHDSDPPPKWLLRRLQAYSVSVRAYKIQAYRDRGLVQEPRDGIFIWMGEYDSRRGLTEDLKTYIA